MERLEKDDEERFQKKEKSLTTLLLVLKFEWVVLGTSTSDKNKTNLFSHRFNLSTNWLKSVNPAHKS